MDRYSSPLRYPGGKQSFAPLLEAIAVENALHDKCLTEPFAGGAGAALRLLFDEVFADIHINDLDPRIHAFWATVLKEPEELIRLIRRRSVSLRRWEESKRVYLSSRPSRLELAYAVFYLNRTNRSGILHSGGPIGGKHQAGTWKLDARFNKEALISRIRRIAEYRERIRVTRIDAISLLTGSLIPSGSLVFLDPPYFHQGQKLYFNSYSHDDHARLAEVLRSNPKFYWVLTYDNALEIRKLYAGLRTREFDVAYSANSVRTSGKELMIVDPRLKLPAEIQASIKCGRLAFDSTRRSSSGINA